MEEDATAAPTTSTTDVKMPPNDGGGCPFHQFCSFAVTGPTERFQPIFVCHTCSSPEEPLCVCQACADYCHDDHADLAYIGMGHCYCDCQTLKGNCLLLQASIQEAKRLQLPVNEDNNHPPTAAASAGTTTDDAEITESNHNSNTSSHAFRLTAAAASRTYVMEAFTIDTLQQSSELISKLQQQARELVKHSKETFWLENTVNNNHTNNHNSADDLCGLEKLAQTIFQQDCHYYGLDCTSEEENNNNDNTQFDSTTGAARRRRTCFGAEWWVQVKPVGSSSGKCNQQQQYNNTNNNNNNSKYNNNSKKKKKHNNNDNKQSANPAADVDEAIDLHYDKDEAVAESFGLGYFPALSTVTYLTSPPFCPPTIVFDRRYEEQEDDPIHDLLISHPAVAKHLVFDGRLVHGAPAQYALRKPVVEEDDDEGKVRATDNNNNHQSTTTTICTKRTAKQNSTVSSGTSSSDTNNTATTNNDDEVAATDQRITFLVNIWYDHQPAGVQPLPSTIRRILQHGPWGHLPALPHPTFMERPLLTRSIDTAHLLPDKDASIRMEVPFLGKHTTWGGNTTTTTTATNEAVSEEDRKDVDMEEDPVDEEEDDDEQLVVSLVPPPVYPTDDTVLYKFGNDLAAYFCVPEGHRQQQHMQVEDDNDDNNDDDDENSRTMDGSP